MSLPFKSVLNQMIGLRKVISSILCIALIVELPIMAVGGPKDSPEQYPNQMTNAHSAPSEQVRELDDYPFPPRVGPHTRELWELIRAEEGPRGDYQPTGIRKDDLMIIESAALYLEGMIQAARSGYMKLASSNEQTALVYFQRLDEPVSRLPVPLRNNFARGIVLGILRYVLARQGPVTNAEKERVDFFLDHFLKALITARPNAEMIEQYLAEPGEKQATRSQSIAASVLVATTGIGLNIVLASKGIVEGATPGLVSVFGSIPLSFYLYGAIASLKLRTKLRWFRKSKLDVAMASYLARDYQPEIVKRMQSRWPDAPSPDHIPFGNRPPPPPTSGFGLRDMIFSPIPSEAYIDELFNSAGENPELAEKLEALIQSDEPLLIMAQQGLAFRDFYLAALMQTFSSQNLDFSLDPELQILHALRVARKASQERKMQPISQTRAEALAWDETRAAFPFVGGMELGTLIARGREPQLYPAYLHFRRALSRFENEERPRLAEKPLDLNQFRKRIKRQINEMRIANFKSALRIFKEKYPQETTIHFRLGRNLYSASIEELLESRIIFTAGTLFTESGSRGGLTANYHLPVDENAPRLNDPKPKLLEKMATLTKWKKRKDEASPRFFRVKPVHPLQMKSYVQISLGNPPNLTMGLSEANFSRLLYELGPEFLDRESPNAYEEQFLAEAARRDAVLADAIGFLEEFRETKAEELEKRLATKILTRTRVSHRPKTLTEVFRDHPQLISDPTLMNGVRLFGFSIHADFWHVRRDMALSGKLSTLRELGGFKAASSVPKKKGILHKDSVIRATLEGAGATAAAVAVVLGGLYVWNRPSRSFQPPSATEPWGDNGGISLPGPGGGSSVPGSPGRQSEGANEERSHGNRQDNRPGKIIERESSRSGNSGGRYQQFGSKMPLEFESLSTATNHPKGSESEGAEPQFLIENVRGTLPSYLNFPAEGNLPKNVEDEEASAKAGVSSRLELEPHTVSRTNAAFAIKTVVPIVARGSFLPLPSPSGYRISSMRLSKMTGANNQERWVPPTSYQVYFDNRTGLSYARLNKEWRGAFYVQAQYIKIDAPRSSSEQASWQNVKWPVLEKVNQSLRELGAKELSSAIASSVRKSKSANIGKVAAAFAISGFYTYDSESMTSVVWSLFSKNPFEPYRRFLRADSFYYQCSGSNRLLADVLTNYYQNTKEGVEVQNVQGFVIRPGAVVSTVGHMHTIAFKLDVPYQYVELDGTPYKMDPKYEESEVPSAVQLQQTSPELSQARTEADVKGMNEQTDDQTQATESNNKPRHVIEAWPLQERKPEPATRPLPASDVLKPHSPPRARERSQGFSHRDPLPHKPEEPAGPSGSTVELREQEKKGEEPKEPDEPKENQKPEEVEPSVVASQPHVEEVKEVEKPDPAKFIFEALVAEINAKWQAMKKADPSLKKLGSGRLPGIYDFALRTYTQLLFERGLDSHELVRQMLRLKHQIPTNRNLMPQELEFLNRDMQRMLASTRGDVNESIRLVMTELNDRFTDAVKNEKAAANRPDNGKEPRRFPYLLDKKFVELINRYYSFFMQTNFNRYSPEQLSKATSKAKTKAKVAVRVSNHDQPRITCQDLFK